MALGWLSSVPMEEALLAWVGWAESGFGVLNSCPAQFTEGWIQVKITGTWVSTTRWTYRAMVCLSVVLGSRTPGPLGLKFLWDGVGGPQDVPSWCPRWQQTSEREAGGVDAEGMVHPWLSGGVGVPG